MKILVTAKKVVDVELELSIHIQDGAFKNEGLQYVMNAWDENAVELAVQLKEKFGAETCLVCIGDEDNEFIIRKGFAMGIDRGLSVKDPGLAKADSAVFAHVLQKLYEKGSYDLVIMGKQAQDTDNGQTGIILAEFAGLPCVSNVISLEVKDDKHLNVARLGDAGTEKIEVEMPAVITVSDSINEPRLPGLRGAMVAKKKLISMMDLSALGTSVDEVGGASPSTEIIEFVAPKKRLAGKIFEGDASEITPRVVSLLIDEAKVL